MRVLYSITAPEVIEYNIVLVFRLNLVPKGSNIAQPNVIKFKDSRTPPLPRPLHWLNKMYVTFLI